MAEKIENHLFNEEELKKVEEYTARFPEKMAATLPVLWMVQDKFGWVSEESMRYVALLLDVPFEHVLGVVTFYTMYNEKPMGKYHLQICTNVSCMLKGGYKIYDHVSSKLGIKNKETTPDGLFTIEEVECLGSCGTAPMLQLGNKEFYENLTIEKVDELIENFKKQG